MEALIGKLVWFDIGSNKTVGCVVRKARRADL
jgi:hypothetical protein